MTLDVSAKNITCVKINGNGPNLLHTPEKVILLVCILQVINYTVFTLLDNNTKISQIIKQDIKFRFLDDIAEKTEHPFGIRKTRRIHSTRSSGNILSNEYLKKKSLSYIVILIEENSAIFF